MIVLQEVAVSHGPFEVEPQCNLPASAVDRQGAVPARRRGPFSLLAARQCGGASTDAFSARRCLTSAPVGQKSMGLKDGAETAVGDIRRKTRKQYSAGEKIRIVLSGLRGEDNIAELCRREGIAESLYYSWSKEFLEAGKKRLTGDTARQASSGEVKDLRREMHDLKEALAEQVLENMIGGEA